MALGVRGHGCVYALVLVKLICLGRKRVERRAKVTTMVNASVVAWNEEEREDELRNEAIVVEIEVKRAVFGCPDSLRGPSAGILGGG